jgi:hypothetical protein
MQLEFLKVSDETELIFLAWKWGLVDQIPLELKESWQTGLNK